VWYPALDQIQYFNLEDDPTEMNELSTEPEYREEIRRWESLMIAELDGRPEGFTDGRKLVRLSGPTPRFLPDFKRPRLEDLTY
jgi:hypothetical protein